MALTSFLTGVTEPVEFSIMFVAPGLYALHALLTGLSMALMSLLHVRLGFTFSAGAFDYLLSYGLSSRGWVLLPIGAITFAFYYGVFVVCIRRFDLATPGRKVEETTGQIPVLEVESDRAHAFILALGGAENLLSVDACTTRLRLRVVANDVLDEAALKSLGARGLVRLARDSVQVVLGPEADLVADQIRAVLQAGPARSQSRPVVAPARLATKPSAPPPLSLCAAQPDPVAAALGGDDSTTLPEPDRAAWIAGFGGARNVRGVEAVATTRLRVELADAAQLDEPTLKQLGARGVMRLSSTLVHVVVLPQATEVARVLRG
jgi:PTS system N-acetylglucosamine-specific IIC component